MKNNYYVKRKSIKPILLFIGLFLSSVAFQTYAKTTLVVNSIQDGTQSEVTSLATGGTITLRYALQYATRDAVKFDASLAGKTITLTNGEIAIAKAVVVDGESFNITIDANQASRIFNVSDGNTANAIGVSIKNLAFKNGKYTVAGNGGGGAILNEENLSVEHSIFENNSAGASTYSGGGAILIIKTSGTDAQLNINNCLFKNNTLTSGYSQSGGGAVGAANFGAGTIKITIENSVFIGNTSFKQGGAVAAFFNATCIMLSNTFINNHAYLYNQPDVYTTSVGGGGAVFSSTSKFTLGGNLFLGNTAGIDENQTANDVHARGTYAHVFTDLGYNVYQADITNSGVDDASTIPTFVWNTDNKLVTSAINSILTFNATAVGGYYLTAAGNTETRIVPQSFISANILTTDIAGVIRGGSTYYNSGAKEYNASSGLFNPRATYEELKCYPNPVKGILYFEEPINGKIDLLSTEGKVIYSAENVTSIDMGGYSPGIYFLRVDNNKLAKIVKTN